MLRIPVTLFLSVLRLFALCRSAQIQGISQTQWDALNATVGGRLGVATPFSRPCFANVFTGVDGEHDPQTCSTIIEDYTNPAFRSNTFGSYMNTEWETCQATSQQCLLNNTNPADPAAFTAPQTCAQGSIPPYYIDVREPSDVQAAFKFSKSSGVPLVVKTTGHDYNGRSSGVNTLAIWMHNIQNISYSRSFVPAGCGKNEASMGVTFGAGVDQGTLYQFAVNNSILLPGGAEATVAAAGGYLQGGGHSAFSNALGLAVDRVLEAKVVTPNGQYLTASTCQNSDLFFAVRGGGGGTFGVVMEITMKAFPEKPFPVVNVQFDATEATETAFVQFNAENALNYANSGWGGYIGAKTGMIFANPILSMEQAEEQMASLKEFTTSVLHGTFSLTMQPSYLAFYNTFLVPTAVPVGIPALATSRLIPVENFQTELSRTQLVDKLVTVVDNAAESIIFAVAPHYFNSDGSGTGVGPAWRNSLWHVVATAQWNFNTTLDQKRAIYASASSNMDLLREITPGSGAYFNEADVREPDHTASFWGSNYERLVQIKRKYDPDHLLDCWHCVDSQGPSAERFSCYL